MGAAGRFKTLPQVACCCGELKATETFGGNVVVTETRVEIAISKQKPSDLFACKWLRAPATSNDEG